MAARPPVDAARVPRRTPGSAAASLLVSALLALAGCTLGPAAEAPPAAVAFDPTPYRGFVVPRPLLPFHLRGAVQVTLRGESESGELVLQALPAEAASGTADGAAYRLELHVRLTGALALELRSQPGSVRLIDYVNKTRLVAPNTADTRLRLFEVDLSPADLQLLLTGRVDAARYAAGDGTPVRGAGEVRFQDGPALHRLRLGANGLPESWVKEREGVPVFRAEFREYLAVAGSAAPGKPAAAPGASSAAPLRVPRKMRLYRGDDPPDAGPVLSIGVSEFLPGASAGVALDAWPPGTEGFAPADLPPLPPGWQPDGQPIVVPTR